MTNGTAEALKAPNLPAITFINGPQPLANEVANILSDITPSLLAHSFDEPLRNAANGLFHNGDPSIDIGTLLDQNVPIPSVDNETIKYADFLVGLHRQLQSAHGGDVLGAFAVRTIEENLEYFAKAIFADATLAHIDDIQRVIKAFGVENCLIVNIYGVVPIHGREARHIDVADGPALEVIQNLCTHLVGTYA